MAVRAPGFALVPDQSCGYQEWVHGFCSRLARRFNPLPWLAPSIAGVPRRLAVALLLVITCAGQSAVAADEVDPRAPSTLRMAERLEQIARTVDPLNARFLAGGQVAVLRRRIAERPDLASDPILRFRLAEALLNSGRNLESLAEFAEAERLATREGRVLDEGKKVNLRLNQALCHLREGERLNCLSNHNADSCLLPLRGGGIHRWPAPSRQAIGILTNLLEEFPDNLAARWLLNVAAMTVGDYPGHVPSRWLIPPRVFASDIGFPKFRELAPLAGLAPNELSGGSVVDDFDGDNLLDVMVTSIGLRDQMRFFRNNGDGTFTERTRQAGLLGLVGGLSLAPADYDNDGNLDVLVLRGAWLREEGRFPNSLLRNRGDGTFEDVTEAAGLLSFHPTQTAAWLDFDGDGWLDFYLGTGDPDLLTIIPNRMFRNAEGRFFQDVTTAGGFGHLQKGHAVCFADIDNDGDQDIYEDMGGAMTGDVYPNVLYENPGFGHHWLKLRLQGVRANRCAIGARVRVEIEEQGRVRSLRRTIGSGGSFGANPLRLELGLGKADRIRTVEILWPGSGTRQSLVDLKLDAAYLVREGDAGAKVISLQSFHFPAADPHAHHHHD